MRRLTMFAALVAALSLSACGGGGGASTATTSTSSSAQPLSHQEFGAQANAACKQATSELEALSAPSNLAGLATFTAQLQPIANDLLSKLTALTPPSDLQAKYSQYLSDQRTALAKFPDLIAAAKSGDQQQAQTTANEITSLSDDALATDLGLTACAKSSQPQG